MREKSEGVGPASFGRRSLAHQPAVIIVGPPWPRSAAVRVIQNQIQYYRERGFFTVFVGVPFRWYFKHVPETPEELATRVNELDADRIFVATFDWKRYDSAKYKASNRQAFRGSILDWQVAIGKAHRLSDKKLDFLAGLRVVLFHDNHLYTLGFALDLRKQVFGSNSKIPIILETHDIQSRLTYAKGDENPRTHKPDRLEQLIKSEVAMLKKANVLIHLSLDDLKFFQKRIPSEPQFLAFPTINEKFRSSVNATAARAKTIDLLFVGQWHPANLAGIRWFLEKVWPRIAHRHYRLKIVGAIGKMVEWSVPQLHDTFRSVFVGEVADLVPYYRAARCVIAPMPSGTGISIKTIEALALGKPLVARSKAFRGMPVARLKEVGIQAFDHPESFAEAISRALSTEHEAARASRAAYEDIFSVQASFAARDKAMRAAIARSQAMPSQLRFGHL